MKKARAPRRRSASHMARDTCSPRSRKFTTRPLPPKNAEVVPKVQPIGQPTNGMIVVAGLPPPRGAVGPIRRKPNDEEIVVPDNLKEGVLTPDIYDPSLNPLYRDVHAHCGVVALSCRLRDPDREGTVEAGVGRAQRTPPKGLRFETLEAAQAHLDRWETR